MGRGQESDVRITDISVSRLHASIFKTPSGHYYLCDNDSKFGTLVQVRYPVRIAKREKIEMQIGRTLLSFKIESRLSDMLSVCL